MDEKNIETLAELIYYALIGNGNDTLSIYDLQIIEAKIKEFFDTSCPICGEVGYCIHRDN